MNFSCNVHVASSTDFFVLNRNCASSWGDGMQSPATCLLYIIQAVVALALAALTAWKYNSLSILNFKIHISATSNNWWITVFGISGARSILQSVQYASRYQDTGMTILIALLHAVEISALGFMLNHQKKYRSTEHISSEIDNYSRCTNSIQVPQRRQRVFLWLGSCDAALIVILSAVILSIILMESLSDYPWAWFWLYFCFLATLNLSVLVIAFLIALETSEDGPSAAMKLYLIIGVLFMIPVDIPVFIWNNCVGIKCLASLFTPFDVLIILKIVSLMCFFLGLKIEFKRLVQQCHWAALNEVQRLGI